MAVVQLPMRVHIVPAKIGKAPGQGIPGVFGCEQPCAMIACPGSVLDGRTRTFVATMMAMSANAPATIFPYIDRKGSKKWVVQLFFCFLHNPNVDSWQHGLVIASGSVRLQLLFVFFLSNQPHTSPSARCLRARQQSIGAGKQPALAKN